MSLVSKVVSGGKTGGGSKPPCLFCEIIVSEETASFCCGGSIAAHAVDLPISYTEALAPGEHGNMRKPPCARSN